MRPLLLPCECGILKSMKCHSFEKVSYNLRGRGGSRKNHPERPTHWGQELTVGKEFP